MTLWLVDRPLLLASKSASRRALLQAAVILKTLRGDYIADPSPTIVD